MRVAIVGTGIAGLGAAWALSRQHDIAVFEAESRIGGHAHTATIPTENGDLAVDTGFIVFNDWTYPNLVKLFDHLDIETTTSDMSFAVSLDGGRLEYSGGSLAGLFAQRRNLFRPSHYGMIRDILKFYRDWAERANADALPDIALGELLVAGGYSKGFVHDHIVPMAAAIWSARPADILCFPARTFLRFLANHGLLDVSNRPQWRTVAGGSKVYVDRLSAPFADRIRRNTPILAAWRSEYGVNLKTGDGSVEHFDQVIFATHADTTAAILTDQDPLERRVLSSFRYQDNVAILHTDRSLMPRRRRAWASWNYMAESRIHREDSGPATVTYWMNRLQNLPGDTEVLVSLNPYIAPAPSTTIARTTYAHPVFDQRAIRMQSRIGEIQGRRGVWVCGAWAGYGFHEDGLASGLAVARGLGARIPWTVSESSPAASNVMPVFDKAGNRQVAA